MLKKATYPVLVLLSLALVFACSSSKTYYKKGNKLGAAGLKEEAAEFYLLALEKNANNIDARVALKKSGQELLEEKLQKFYKLYTAEEHVDATQQYIEAIDYQKLVDPYVKLDIPPYYEDYYDESKAVFLEDRYQKASDLINANKFEAAEQYLNELLAVDPTYKDAASLKNYSNVEPVYLDAVDRFEAGSYVRAYELLTRVIKMSGNYKQAPYYRDEALAKGRLTIAVVKINASGNEDLGQMFARKVLQEGSKTKDPFLVYLDRENTDAILDEQKLGLTGLLDEKTAVETGKLLGAKYLIQCRISSYNQQYVPLKSESKKGYHETIVRKYSKAKGYHYNQKTYQKTNYKYYYQKRVVSFQVELTMVSAETGEVVLTQIYKDEASDILEYAEYPKSHSALYPGHYKSKSYSSPEDKVNKDLTAKQKLNKQLAEKKRSVKSEQALKVELSQKIAKDWAWRVQKFKKSLM